jgi:2-oxoglutarate ferredoxin oxidoreductase subunit beta
MSVQDYLRTRFFPHIWCPGCGHGTVLNGLLRSVESLGIPQNDIVMVSGIGCSARISGYVDFHTLHTLHGRALAFAMGVKMSRPELTLLVPMGDGDALAIGGNHFIHAARRNIDMTAIILNNRIYGMTGGQFSPLSGCEVRASTAPHLSIDPAFDVVRLAASAGASFVARTTTYHVHELERLLTRAIRHPGFSVVEVLSQCPTYFGRHNDQGDAVDMLRHFKEQTAPIGSSEQDDVYMHSALDAGQAIPRGVFVEREAPEYAAEYRKLVDRAAEAGPRADPAEDSEEHDPCGS